MREKAARRQEQSQEHAHEGSAADAASDSDDTSSLGDGLAAHDGGGSHHNERHASAGEVIKNIVFGGLDGIVTTFAIVAAAAASHLAFSELLIVGFANLVGDAFGMGLGDFFSTRSEDESYRAKKRRYLWLLHKHPERQHAEMQEIYEGKGFNEEESREIVDNLARNPRAFAELMLLEKDGAASGESLGSALKSAIVTFISFIVFGAVPMIPYLFALGRLRDKSGALDVLFFVSVGATLAALLLLGVVKNAILKKNMLVGGIFYVVQGGITTALAYLVGWLIERFLLLPV